jgi:hypothetical protein
MKNNNDHFIIFLACSIALHLVIVYFFLFGLPPLFNKAESQEEVIYFEMLPTSDISNIKNQKKTQEKAIENEEAKKVERAKTEPVEEKKNREPKAEPPEQKQIEEKQAIEEEAKDKTQDKPKEMIDLKQPEKIEKPQNKDTKKDVPKKESVKENKKDNKKKKPSNSELDSLLKTLEESSEGTANKSSKHLRSQSNDAENSKGNYDENLPLSITEMNLIKRQIEANWKPPSGARDINKIRITLFISMDKDGSVLEVQVVEKNCPFGVSEVSCNSMANSAIIAVKKASPIANLNIDRYNVWRNIRFEFDPSNISR